MKYGITAVSPKLELSREVAIVGNSPKSIGLGLGKDIDAHSDVIRFNGAIVDDYKEDIGSKTTLMFIGIDIAYLFTDPYRRPSKDEDKNEENRLYNANLIKQQFEDCSFLTFSPLKAERKEKNKQYKTATYLKQAGVDKLYFLNEEGKGACMSYYQANKDFEELGLTSKLSFGGPRSGIKMVLRLVLSGIKPKLYGFDIDTNLEFAQHYYDSITNDKIDEYKPHDIKGEMYLLIEMHQKGLIEIVS